ncbi:MAG: biopolymer transporter ExbD [Lentisphaerae bacterium]|nr:MAG: biopolymer transporter ExbD [Lentisphaerota bacterium]
MRFNTEESDDVDVQMTPMIDCVFLLLIFFLVATVLKKIEKELPVDLPVSAAAMKMPQDEKIMIIGIDPAGKYYLNSTPITLEMLHSKLRELGKTNPQQRIRIDGDRNAPFQAFVHIVDLCHFENLTNIGVHTKTMRKK